MQQRRLQRNQRKRGKKLKDSEESEEELEGSIGNLEKQLSASIQKAKGGIKHAHSTVKSSKKKLNSGAAKKELQF